MVDRPVPAHSIVTASVEGTRAQDHSEITPVIPNAIIV